MRAFIDAMVRKDKSAVLAFFSPGSPWQYMAYEIGTNKVVANKMVSYPVMAKISPPSRAGTAFSSMNPMATPSGSISSVARCGRSKAPIPSSLPTAIRAAPPSPGNRKGANGSFRKSAKRRPEQPSAGNRGEARASPGGQAGVNYQSPNGISPLIPLAPPGERVWGEEDCHGPAARIT